MMAKRSNSLLPPVGCLALVVVAVIGLVLLAQYFGSDWAPHRVAGTDESGFLIGWLNGLLVFPTFILSLFDHSLNIYQLHNNGGWYNFGFLIGAGLFVGGASSSRS